MLETFYNKFAGLSAYNFIKKETPTQVFSCKYCKIFKSTFFEEHLQATASAVLNDILFQENESMVTRNGKFLSVPFDYDESQSFR